MKKNLVLLIASVVVFSNYDIAKSQSTLVEMAPGAKAPTTVKGTTSSSRVAATVPSLCEAPDIRVFPSALPQSEVHISINKQNPQVLVLSANTFPEAPNDSWQGAYWSTNGGANWAGADDLPNNLSGRGDPSTGFDANNNGYVASMARSVNSVNFNDPPVGYSLLRTANSGVNWALFNRVADNIDGFDKEMIGADDVPGSPFANNIYSAWSVLPTSGGNSVQFHRSNDGGNTFTAPITLKNGWGQGTNVQTGPNGDVYVCWADYTNGSYPAQGLGFVRSTDGGLTFTAAAVPFTYTGIRKSGGADPNFNGIRVNDFPSMAVDKSNGANRGRIYAVYAAQENGNGKAVVQIRSSNNFGVTWTSAQTISIANGRQNWFPWIATDNLTGYVYVTYYSLDEATGFNTNTYLAISTDGGDTFLNQIVSDVNHVTAPIAEFGGGYCGDYIGITAHNGAVYASWTDNRNGQWQIYVSPDQVYAITGPSFVCATNTTFTINDNNMPPGATANWTSGNTQVLTIDANTGVATRVGSNNGIGSISSTVTAACGQVQVPALAVYVGNPGQIGSLSQNINNPPFCVGDIKTPSIEPVEGASDYLWSSSDPSILEVNGDGTSVNLLADSPGTCNILVVVSNACGNSQKSFIADIQDCSCNPCVVYYPNPASGSLTVQVTDNSSTSSSTNKLDQPYQLDLVDRFSKKVFSLRSDDETTIIPVNNLPPDIYYLDVIYKNAVQQKQIVIKR